MVEFPGTVVGKAFSEALSALHNRLPSIVSDVTKCVERNGNISVDALSDYCDELAHTFSEKLYSNLKKEGVEIS